MPALPPKVNKLLAEKIRRETEKELEGEEREKRKRERERETAEEGGEPSVIETKAETTTVTVTAKHPASLLTDERFKALRGSRV